MKRESKVTNKLENIEEENVAEWLPVACPQPETPTETMEFLARSWSVSAMELSKALCVTHDAPQPANEQLLAGHGAAVPPADRNQPLLASESPPVSPRGSDDAKEIFLLHQALNPEIISNQQLLRNGIYRTILKRKTTGRWMKDQKERKKQEIRAHNAQLHAAVAAAGVAAAVAALAASLVSSPEKSTTKHRKSSKKTSTTAIASAAALVASHCIEIAEDLGADHDHILSVVNSAISARTNGDVMTLTAGAATGDLHWKQVSFNINSNWQVVVKMKSKHMGGTFTKKKKCVVAGVYDDIPVWPGRETEQMEYFAIQTADRVIEFECRNKGDRQMWVEGIQNLLHLRLM